MSYYRNKLRNNIEKLYWKRTKLKLEITAVVIAKDASINIVLGK